ncbi:MAG: 3-phosphoshikimate 1-carboxyvinyltransferase [Erysipelotrichales bacterium]|nr:3-phosphoshikimate 1-carboxyvinyltransferase [Erysipelotrichales bacterium]
MKATIYPGTCSGTIHIPPSKSMSHRALLCAALSKGTSHITNLIFSEDIQATLDAIVCMGASVRAEEDSVYITGVDGKIDPTNTTIDCKESGSTLRFTIPLLSLSEEKITFLGRNRLLHRPLEIYQKIFMEQGASFQQSDTSLTIQGSLHSGEYTLPGNISSQFITGLLYTLPLLKENSTLHILPPFESRSYVALTIQMLERFHIHIQEIDAYTYYIPGNQHYIAQDYTVEGDYSQAAFFAVLAAINHDLTLTGIQRNSKQGDKVILEYLSACEVDITYQEDHITVHKSSIQGRELDLVDCPDLGPILTVLGMYAKGDHILSSIARLRLKESDRVEAMEKNLRALGVEISSDADHIYIHPTHEYTGQVECDGAKDHRIVMSLAVAATMLPQEITITHAEAIHKSYPSFFKDLQDLGIHVRLEEA